MNSTPMAAGRSDQSCAGSWASFRASARARRHDATLIRLNSVAVSLMPHARIFHQPAQVHCGVRFSKGNPVIRRRHTFLCPSTRRTAKRFLMKSTFKVLQLVLLALCATLAHAGPFAAPKAPQTAINPQPRPPSHAESMARIAINPQPLPPRDPEPQQRRASPKAYIGETEKNWR